MERSSAQRRHARPRGERPQSGEGGEDEALPFLHCESRAPYTLTESRRVDLLQKNQGQRVGVTIRLCPGGDIDAPDTPRRARPFGNVTRFGPGTRLAQPAASARRSQRGRRL